MPEEPQDNLQQKLAEIRRESEERIAKQLAQRTGFPYIDLRKIAASIEALSLVDEAEARKAQIAPFQLIKKKVAIAVASPKDSKVDSIIKTLSSKGYEAKLFVASLSGIKHLWESYKFVPKAIKKSITGTVELDTSTVKKDLEELSSLENVIQKIGEFNFQKLETIRFLKFVLLSALAVKASDIHLEAEEEGAKIRFRVDGILYDIFNDLPKKNYRALVSRIKLISELKINVTDEPQDGRFTIAMGFKEVEVRVSTIPSEFGETIVMRLLDPDSIKVDLPRLGFREDDAKLIEEELGRPNGAILNTGPTGSGKTTTLYAFLRHVNKPEVKIITVEDPIEYHLEGVEQTQVDPLRGYTFASGLRSILRQDPDIILVGEIRDKETAEIAMQAALTGHLVFSTLHTNDSFGAIPRLVELGVRPDIIAPALNLVIAQRLVRRLCPDCKKEQSLDKEMQSKIKHFLEQLPPRIDKTKYIDSKVYVPGGCSKCSNIGYKGRVGIFEFLRIDKTIEELLSKSSSEAAIREASKAQGVVTMQEDGILKVLAGLTTFEEVERITGKINW